VFYNGVSGGKDVLRAALFGLEPGVINAARASPLGELLRLGKHFNERAGAGSNWAKGHYTRAGHELSFLPCSLAAFVVNFRHSPGHVPRFVCVCV
jgi:hypothetical protein